MIIYKCDICKKEVNSLHDLNAIHIINIVRSVCESCNIKAESFQAEIWAELYSKVEILNIKRGKNENL